MCYTKEVEGGMSMSHSYRNSEISDYQRCRKKWNWRWNEGYTPKKQNSKLFFGNLMHKYLETLYKTGWTTDATNEEESVDQDPVACEEIWNMFYHVSNGYEDKWWENDKEWEIIATEFEFEVPLDDKITYTGTIDLIFQHKGKIWFMDHKTTSSLDIYDNNSRMDRQISRYWWALKKLGYDVGGFIYNIILKDYPVAPKVLKNGKLSTAKNQNTTLELYEGAIEELGQFKEAYMDFLEYLENYPREYFRRVSVTRSDAELANAMFEFYQAALEATEIKEQENSPRIYRNITKDCSWDCPFMDACKADMDGSNIEFLMNMAFNKEEVK
jgi:tetratricopeptide (TPR) repeat protein